MDRFQYLARILPAPHQHDTLDSIAVLAQTEDSRGWRGADHHFADIANENRHALRFRDHDVLDVAIALDQAHSADDHRLLPVIQHGAPGIRIIGAYGLCDLADGEVV